MVDPTPIANPIWMWPMWKPTRPYCLSYIEVTLGTDGQDTVDPGGIEIAGITVQLVIAPDPADGLGAGYFTIAEAFLDARGPGVPMQRRAVAEVPWPFGPRIIPAGWWVAACHDCDWEHHPDEKPPNLSLQPHGTDL
jgi:hypothetical protein